MKRRRPSIYEVPSKDGDTSKQVYTVTIENGRSTWRNQAGELDNPFGPAIALENGDCEWWTAGRRHNEMGPAVVMGPAYEYWVDGTRMTIEEYRNWTALQFGEVFDLQSAADLFTLLVELFGNIPIGDAQPGFEVTIYDENANSAWPNIMVEEGNPATGPLHVIVDSPASTNIEVPVTEQDDADDDGEDDDDEDDA